MESALSNIRHYQSLGLKNTGASLEEVKRAYKKLSLRYHPDRNSDPSATAKFQDCSYLAQASSVSVSSTARHRAATALGFAAMLMLKYARGCSTSPRSAPPMPMSK